ncbi:excalibur calcium-binding domain-containing protein [Rhodovulum sp. DZ06]|uniref:excalibur calcium-binding domain-containing protein n=1 Tax=Rhodovulum sp. DZ06 TaxID=3425126 RepID=UPI003D34BD16
MLLAAGASHAQDRNCADFRSHAEAQDFFLSQGGPQRDPHGLDGDGDGQACEATGWGATARAARSSRGTAGRNCSDFRTHAQAQRFYTAEGGPARDPHRLDRDRDGLACEGLPGGRAAQAARRQARALSG